MPDMVDAFRALYPESDAAATEIEGDPSTWHIRLDRRIEVSSLGPIESWSLFNGDCRESSPSLKEAVQQWRDEELAKLQQ